MRYKQLTLRTDLPATLISISLMFAKYPKEGVDWVLVKISINWVIDKPAPKTTVGSN